MDEQNHLLLIHKSISGIITTDEKNSLMQWLEQSRENLDTYNSLKFLWEAAARIETRITANQSHVARERDKLKAKIALLKNRELRSQRLRMMYQAVAILTLFITSLTLLIAYVAEKRLNNNMLVTTSKKELVTLPDNTLVSLNEKSEVTYKQRWKERTVNFQGEAFFDVAKNESQPFTIQIPQGSVKVIGTSFFLKATKGDTAKIKVLSGVVELSSGTHTVRLDKGETGLIPPNEYPILVQDTDQNFTSWYTGKLQFEKTSLDKILKLLQAQYGITFQVTDPKILKCRFTGTFDNESLDTILEVLSTTLEFEYQTKGSTCFIKGTGCHQN